MIVARQKSYLNVFLGIIGLVILGSALFLLNRISLAEDAAVKWSWTQSSPTTYSSNKVANIDAGLCANSGEVKEVSGYSDLKGFCMNSGESFSFGFYGDVSVFRTAVGFRFDPKMYKLSGPCESRLDSCTYLSKTDTLVTKQYCGAFCMKLVIYKNFSTRLRSIITPGLTTGIDLITKLEYDFDTSNPDYIFKTGENYIWGIGGYGVSDNGKWVAVEIKQRGIGLLNIDTLQMKKISWIAPSYGVGYDPTMELAVDDSGEHIAVAGVNSGLHVFDVTSDCGGDATYDVIMGYVRDFVYCGEASIDTNSFIPHFRYAIQPKFNNNGSELRFYSASYVAGEQMRQVTLRANGYNPPRLDYLALGDSFSSGEGDMDQNHYLNGTNDAYENCHTSDRSYPFLLARQLEMDMGYVKSVACSGARTKDVIGSEDKKYFGQSNRLKQMGYTPDRNDIVPMKDYAKYNFIPGRIYQEAFVDYYKPKVVTVGIGGNDANLMGKLRSCFGPMTCEWASDAAKRAQTAYEIQSLFYTLVDTYKQLIKDSPDSKIYVIGYPQIIDDGDNCGTLGDLLDRVERHYMIESIHYLNQVVASAAKSAGIEYVDIENSYGNNIICGSESPSFVNSVEFGGVEELVNGFRYYKLIHSEGFHPNNLGHQKDTEAIISQIGDITLYDYCQNGLATCPDGNVRPPEPADYWFSDGLRYVPILFGVDLVPDRITDEFLNVTIELDSSSLLPNSIVDIDIHSAPVSLGQFTTSGDGSLSANLYLPSDLEEGYHTIYLHGTTYSNQPIDLYHIFIYEKEELPDDSITSDGQDDVVDIVDNGDIGSIDNTDNENSNIDNDQEISESPNQITVQKPVNNQKNKASIANSVSVASDSQIVASVREPIESGAVKGASTSIDARQNDNQIKTAVIPTKANNYDVIITATGGILIMAAIFVVFKKIKR